MLIPDTVLEIWVNVFKMPLNRLKPVTENMFSYLLMLPILKLVKMLMTSYYFNLALVLRYIASGSILAHTTVQISI